ncbi:HAD-superfamily hydrolase [Tanticharoenia sakaeratensis NBRC 103193]|uniref:HAD-superfamily hydrolase n=2 Tax=Tanticharoenia TaxID=444052 RepID=A0A0D6MLU0_9PROT|nr:HAD-superfamily hydrolase [Tanticharoenia sakaeratensis NBRC 103193]GBQ18690.1 phosphatase [Tanticharoenia sakaeratensis NBRC 103193]
MTAVQNNTHQAPSSIQPDGHLEMVIFDCDGVLVDGERLSTNLMAQEARKYGWNISDDEAHALFTGGELAKIRDRIAQESGKTLPDDWDMMLQNRIVRMMKTDAETVDGAEDMLAAVLSLGLPIRIGSNSSLAEMDAKFAATGLDSMLERDRIHSGRDLDMPKPRPDIYLHAAAEEGVEPGNCIVLEDSDAGVEAARRAGMACVLLRDLSKPGPEWPGLLRIGHLSEFQPLLSRILESQKVAA